jgi:hypothetical protein
MIEDLKLQERYAREEQKMGNENDEPNSGGVAADPHPTNRIYVGRRYQGMSTSWTEHNGSFDEVVEKMREKALDGKASSDGFEVAELTVARSVIVKPVITATEVTETGASA